MARPRKEIDKKNFESLCELQCTEEEFCGFFGCCTETLNAWCKRTYGKSFSEIFKEKRGAGKVSLRRAQFQAAKNGNATMLVWLGRNWLGQSENKQEEATKNELMQSVKKLLDDIND